MKKTNWKTLIVAIVICNLAGIIGSLATMPSIHIWYSTLIKPGFAPPNWVFGPVWTILYALMGISAYLIWQSKKSQNRTLALKFFGAQLLVNSLWPFMFFGLRDIFMGLVGFALVLPLLMVTMVKFYKINKTASYLLIPYLVWGIFACIVNIWLWVLN